MMMMMMMLTMMILLRLPQAVRCMVYCAIDKKHLGRQVLYCKKAASPSAIHFLVNSCVLPYHAMPADTASTQRALPPAVVLPSPFGMLLLGLPRRSTCGPSPRWSWSWSTSQTRTHRPPSPPPSHVPGHTQSGRPRSQGKARQGKAAVCR